MDNLNNNSNVRDELGNELSGCNKTKKEKENLYNQISKCENAKIDYSLKNIFNNGIKNGKGIGIFTSGIGMLGTVGGTMGTCWGLIHSVFEGGTYVRGEDPSCANRGERMMKTSLLGMLGAFGLGLCLDGISSLVQGAWYIHKNNSIQEEKINKLKEQLKTFESVA